MMNSYDFIGFSLNDGVPNCSVVDVRYKPEMLMEWYIKQDHVFENINGEFKLLPKEEYIRRYDKYIEETVNKNLEISKENTQRLLKEIEIYGNFKKECLK